jgi:predicted ester cyclase
MLATTSASMQQDREQFYATLRAAFPDIHFMIEDQIAEGDRVVTRWSARATHTGEYQGISPTGKQLSVTGIDIDRIANGKVVECWPHMDELGLLQQLGVVPTPGQAGQEQTRDAWDKIAAGSDEFVTPTPMWLANEGLCRADLRPGMRFLDVATGSGAFSLPAAHLGAPVMAADISPTMVERPQWTVRRIEHLLTDLDEPVDGPEAIDENETDEAKERLTAELTRRRCQ